ncbi:cilia- and flagella-associated protein 74-like isoform X1 [Mytilus edulis]|uniref:cilia- and flagella-associated protein 74-like isoform X1 n=1 Tax=Mytilus edulis TaxID=6550 RepID=UPI0039EEB96F
MDEDYGHMFGGEEYLDDDGFDDDIIDYDDGDAGGDDLDLGSEEDAESQIEEPTPELLEEKISKKEQLHMIHLRALLNEMTEKVKHHQYLTEKTREEMKQCRSRMSQLETERDQVFGHIQSADSDGNTSALYRLRDQHAKLCQELEDERTLEKMIQDRLENEEYELAKVEVERGKFLLAEDELVKKEHQLATEKTDMALDRLKKEEWKVRKAIHHRKSKERQQFEALEDHRQRQQMHIEDSKQSHEKHQKYLSATMEKMKKRQDEENIRYKENMHKKMDMLLKLKSDITSNRENLKALHARDKALDKEKKQQEEEERQRILSEGGNPDQEFLIRKRIETFERHKSDFEVQKRSRESTIMGKILLEEERMRKRKKQQPQLFSDPKREKSLVVSAQKKKPLKIMRDMSGSSVFDETELRDSKVDFLMDEFEKQDDSDSERRQTESVRPSSSDEKKIPDSSDSEDGESDDERKVDLAQPEFQGLWSEHKPYKVPSETHTVKLPGASKMEKEILNKVLDKHRSGIIVKQVAAGREFQGCPFYSKPDVIHFKDFDVGKSYKKKVTLTNVSYTVNYCKYINITEHLKDFIEIQFDPPGQMSAGLTCEMMVTFKPMINEDLVGEVNFLSQTGPFSIVLKCTTKKCDLSVDTNKVEFGTTVIGETLKRTFTLTNNGALGTKYEFFKLTGSKLRTVTTAETSLGRLTTADTLRGGTPDSLSMMKKEPVPPGDKKPDQEIVDKASQEGGGTSIDHQGTQAEADAMSGTMGDVEDGEQSPDLAISEIEDYGSLDGMKVGPMSTGEVGPFSSVKLEIIWQPHIPGKVFTEFLISFSDPLSESISIHSLANAIDVPVWVERQTVDLKICMYDRLYQDTIIVNNRATTALRLKFEVCKELKNHLELLPKTGYIQAQSQFSAQLKFLPRKSLFQEAGKYFDKETGVLEAPMIIRVADQTQPVPFTVQAVVTTSDMEFDITNINFGCCTIHESTKTRIRLSNKSILPQEYGFVGLPDYVEVQPDDGFGTLLPLESIDLDVIFSPKKAREYKFELNCKSIINREFKIQCEGVGVHPPLDLSHQVIHFAATALYDVSTATVHVNNSHISTNEFTHPVPRIGKGEIVPVGPTSFEFKIPEGAPLTISPSVGTIEPGKKCRVQVRFAPQLEEMDVRKEGVRMASKAMEAKAQKEYQESLQREKEKADEALADGEEDEKSGNKGKGKEGKSPAKGKGRQSPGVPTLTVAGPKPFTPPTLENITKDTPAYAAALGSLLRQYRSCFRTYVIPCYVASGKCGNPGELPYTNKNTLYMEVHCPVVKPTLVAISDHGKTTLDFGEVSLGQTIIKSVTIQNISKKTIELTSSLLDTSGPFLMLNALRILPPDGTHTILISFTPEAGRVFHEVLQINSGTSVLHVTVMGEGVNPIINLDMPTENGVFDIGAVLAGEYLERTFKMQNSSSLSIDYSIKLESLSLLRHAKSQELPSFIKPDEKMKSLVGTQNNNGQNIFDLVPSEGRIAPGATQEVTVTFAPDHPSDHYSDFVKIELFGKKESHSFQIKGMAKKNVMFVHGVDETTVNVESLSEHPPSTLEEEELKGILPSVLFSVKSIAKESEFVPGSREIYVGCVRTMAVSQKKEVKGKKFNGNGEFQFENVQAITSKGFNIDPQRGMVEAGNLKPVTVTWSPPPGHDPNEPVEASIILTLKGDITEQVKVMLRAYVVSDVEDKTEKTESTENTQT